MARAYVSVYRSLLARASVKSDVLISAVNTLTDLTARKRTEQYGQRLASIGERSDDAIVGQTSMG